MANKKYGADSGNDALERYLRGRSSGGGKTGAGSTSQPPVVTRGERTASPGSTTGTAASGNDALDDFLRGRGRRTGGGADVQAKISAAEAQEEDDRKRREQRDQERAWRMQELTRSAAEAARQGFRSVGQVFHRDPAAISGAAAERAMRMNQLYQAMADEAARTGNQELLRYAQERSQETVGQARNVYEQQRTGNRPGIPGAAQGLLNAQERATGARSYQPEAPTDRDRELQTRLYNAASRWAPVAAAIGDQQGLGQDVRTMQRAAGNLQRIESREQEAFYREHPEERIAATMTQEEIRAELERAKRDKAEAQSVGSAGYASLAPSYQTDLKPDSVHGRERQARADRIQDAEDRIGRYEQALQIRESQDTWNGYLGLRSNPDFAEKSKFKSTRYGNPEYASGVLGGGLLDSGYADLMYDAVNGDKSAQTMIREQELSYSYSPQKYDNWFNLPQEYVEIYNYIHQTQGQDAAESFLQQIADYKVSPIDAAALGFGQGIGLLPVLEAGVRAGNAIAGNDSSAMDELYRVVSAAQRGNSLAFGAGSIAGNLALMGASGKLAGSAAKALGLSQSGVTAVTLGGKTVRVIAAPVTTRMATSAMTFALTDAIHNMGNLAAGRMSAGQYLGSVGISAAGGAAGTLADYLVSSGMANVLQRNGWMTSFGEYTRKVAASTAFAWTNMGTRQLLSEQKMSGDEFGRELVTSFLYNVVSSGIQTIKETGAYTEGLDQLKQMIQDGYSRFSDAGMTPEQKIQLAEEILGYTQQLRESLNGIYLPGQQAYVNDMNTALDAMEELLGAYRGANQFYTGATSGYGGNQLGAGGGLTVYGVEQSGQGPDPIRQEMQRQITAGIQEGLAAAGQDQGPTAPISGGMTPVQGQNAPALTQGQTAEIGPGRQTESLPSMALESVEAEGRAIGIQSGQGMTDAEIRQNVQTLLELQQDPSQTEAGAASLRGQIRGLQEVLNERAAGTERTETIQPVDWIGNRAETGAEGPGTRDGDAKRVPVPSGNVTRDGGPVPYENGGLNNERIQGRSEVGGIGQNAGTDATSSVSLGADTFPSRGRLAGGQLVRAVGEQGTVAGNAGAADGGQRNAGLDSRGPAGVLGESAGSAEGRAAERGGTRKEELAAIRHYVQAQGTERRSARDLGIRDGTKNARNVLLEGAALSDGMVQLQAEAEQAGTRLDFVTGSIEAVAGGQVRRASGVFQVDEDGTPHIFVQADSRARAPEQLYRHELFHSIVKQNRGLWQQIVEHLNRNYTQEEIASIVGPYIDAYEGCYGVDEADVERYLEEIFADVYAEMDRGGGRERASREALRPVVQRFAGDIENARQNRAGIERRNGPGTRLSIEADTELEEKNITDGKAAVISLIEQAKTSDDPESLVIENAMYRSDIGYIDIKWGTPGRGSKFKGGYGLSHIIEKRNAETGDGEKVAYQIVEAIAKATTADAQYSNQVGQEYHRIRLHYNGVTAVLSKEPGSNHWLLTGWNENETAASANGEVHDSSAATAVTPTRTRRNGDATVSNNNIAQTTRESNTSGEKNPEAIEWLGNRGTMLSQAEEEDGVDRAGSEEEDEAPPHPSASQTPSPQGEGSGAAETASQSGQAMLASTGSEDADATTDATEDAVGLAREKKEALAEKATIDGLKSRIQSAEDRLRALKAMQSTGLLARDERSQAEWKRRIADVEETLEIDRAALKAKQDARKAEKADKAKQAAKRAERKREKAAAKKEAELAADKPRQARKEFREDALNLFSVSARERYTLRNILNDFADNLLAKGTVSERDRSELFRQLYEAGVEIVGPADDTKQDIRDFVKSGRIYVPQEVRSEFGDDWIPFNEWAWGNRIYFTRDVNDRGADAWNTELAELWPGSFDAEETDTRTILENIVNLAEEGKGEHISIGEMMRRNEEQTGWTVDQQMDELEQKVDRLIDTFAQKASLERKVRTEGAMKLAMERKRNRERVEREQQRRRESELRNDLMKKVQKLSRMRKRVGPEFQGKIDDLIGRADPNGEVGIRGMFGVIDTMARQITPTGLENLQELARKYKEFKAEKGQDFIPNPGLEARIARLGEIQIDDLNLEDVITLAEAVSGLFTQIQNQNRLLADEHNREISASAGKFNQEVLDSSGGGILEPFYAGELLDVPAYIQHITGWERGGEGERFAKTLQKATTDEIRYIQGANAIIEEFLQDEENAKWFKKNAGRNAEIIELDVPVNIGKDESGNTVTETRHIRITPMMRVALLMHSRNYANLQHIEVSGITIPNVKKMLKGDMAGAIADADPIRMSPSTVKAIVEKCTDQEKALAKTLAKYFDEYSKQRINETSVVLDGYWKAAVEHYFPIESDKSFLGKGNSYMAYDRSLESIGSLKERQNGVNPIVLGDAMDVMTRHMNAMARYCAFAIPMRDFNEVIGYAFHEEGKPFAGSVKKSIGKKFTDKGVTAIEQIQAALAQADQRSNSKIARILRTIRGRMASANLGGNIRVMMSQFASLPYALPYLDGVDLISSFGHKVDTEVRDIYSPLSRFRRSGYINQELADMKGENAWVGKIPVIGTGITNVDTFTINRLWAAAVNHVKRTTDLTPGSREQIMSGNDPFYQKVAEVYEDAVYHTQPNYTTVQRPALLRDGDEMVRSLFQYKTVPLRVYGMLYEAAGRIKNDTARYQANKTEENRKNLKESQRFFRKTQIGVLAGTVLYVALRALNGAGLFREKKYRDEDGNITVDSIAKALGKDLLDTYAGSFIGATEAIGIWEKIDKTRKGESLYSSHVFDDLSSLGELENAVNIFANAIDAVVDLDWKEGKKSIRDAARETAILGFGFPAKNVEKFMLSSLKWIHPEWADRYENYFDEYERGDLDAESERFLRASVRVMMDNRCKGLSDETIDELVRLWENDNTIHIPSAIPSDIEIEGEKVKFSVDMREQYRETWGQVVQENLEALLASDGYEAADDKDKADLIKKLYDYAAQTAAGQVTGRSMDNWVLFGKACVDAGIPLEDYLAIAAVSEDKLKDMDGTELDEAIRARMQFRVGELDDEVLDELGRLYEGGAAGVIPADIPTGFSVGDEDIDLSPERRVAWLRTWKLMTGESLGALLESEAYKKASDEDKAKLIGSLYEVATATAKMEASPQYEAKRWITAGLNATSQGVPMAEYLQFHYEAGKLKTDKDKIQLLQKQGWDDRQMETVWTGAFADEDQIRKYENLKAGGASWKDAMAVMDIGGDAAEDLTPEQKEIYRKKWDEITGPATKALMKSQEYKKAKTEQKEAYVDKLNTYASAAAKYAATKKEPERWVKAGLDAVNAGVSLDQYIVFTVNKNKLTGKENPGDDESLDGLLLQRTLELLNKTSWTEKQKELVFLKAIADESQSKKVKALRDAGLTWKQTSDAMGTLGKDLEKAHTITSSSATEDTKLKALEVYLTESRYESARACRAFEMPLDNLIQAMIKADANKKSGVSQEEAEEYISGLSLNWEEKAYLWQMLCKSTWNKNKKQYSATWKKNPYSTTLGYDVWDYIYGGKQGPMDEGEED